MVLATREKKYGEWDINIHLQLFRSCSALTLPVIQASLEELRENGLATMRELPRGNDKNAKVYFPAEVAVSLNTLPLEKA